MKNEFVFKEVSGDLVYVGDFEGLYQNETDPWGQSASADAPMDLFYKHSREILASMIESFFPAKKIKILEVGCGHGHSTRDLAGRLPMSEVIGMDISLTAIAEAKNLFPRFDFLHGDIRALRTENSAEYDAVVLHQMLWYVLNDLPLVFHNSRHLLRPTDTSVCFVTQAFPRKQRFGGNVLDGYEGAMKYFKNIPGVQLVHSAYSDLPNLPHIDCHFALKFQ